MTRARAAGVVLGATAAAALGALAWGVLVERTRFTVRREVLPILEPGSRPLTILHLSDLHMAPWQRTKQDFVRSLVRYAPDLIVDTGDNLGHEDGLAGIRRAFEPFRGIPGVFAHGSNDFHGPVLKNPLAYFGGPSGAKPRYAPKPPPTRKWSTSGTGYCYQDSWRHTGIRPIRPSCSATTSSISGPSFSRRRTR